MLSRVSGYKGGNLSKDGSDAILAWNPTGVVSIAGDRPRTDIKKSEVVDAARASAKADIAASRTVEYYKHVGNVLQKSAQIAIAHNNLKTTEANVAVQVTSSNAQTAKALESASVRLGVNEAQGREYHTARTRSMGVFGRR